MKTQNPRIDLRSVRISDGQYPRGKPLQPRFGIIWLGVLALLPTASADVFNDDLCHGIDRAYWIVQSNQPLYSVDATTAGVRFRKPVGGDHSFQYVMLQSPLVAEGDFELLPPGQVLISWTAYPSGASRYSSPSLPATLSWVAVTNSPVLSGNRLFVTNTVDGAARFYRLK